MLSVMILAAEWSPHHSPLSVWRQNAFGSPQCSGCPARPGRNKLVSVHSGRRWSVRLYFNFLLGVFRSSWKVLLIPLFSGVKCSQQDGSHHQLRDGTTLNSWRLWRLSCSPSVQCQQPGPGSASGAVHNHLIGHKQHLEQSDWPAGAFPVLRLVQDQCLSWCQLQPNWLFLTVINQEFCFLCKFKSLNCRSFVFALIELRCPTPPKWLI